MDSATPDQPTDLAAMSVDLPSVEVGKHLPRLKGRYARPVSRPAYGLGGYVGGFSLAFKRQTFASCSIAPLPSSQRLLNPPRNLYPFTGCKVLADVVLGLACLLTPPNKTFT